MTAPEEREFIRREEYSDRIVDVYEINTEVRGSTFIDSEVYINPNTGHVVRIERVPFNAEFDEDSREVIEFFDHGEPETADINLMQERSTHETGSDLDELPWE